MINLKVLLAFSLVLTLSAAAKNFSQIPAHAAIPAVLAADGTSPPPPPPGDGGYIVAVHLINS